MGWTLAQVEALLRGRRKRHKYEKHPPEVETTRQSPGEKR